MKKWIMCAAILMPLYKTLIAQSRWEHIDRNGIVSSDTFTRQGFTLIFINKDSAFNNATGKAMVETFFKVYPQQAVMYNSKTLKKVIFIIDPAYKGVAATAGGIVRYSPDWMEKHPEDIDVVTHEVMHITQSYPHNAGPGWITEGIADYVRYSMGVANETGGWRLPEFKDEQHYENAYRVTARFLAWIEKHKKKGFVQQLDAAMRQGKYTAGFWQQQAGADVNELWKEYAANPTL